jgi:hypothetical protein
VCVKFIKTYILPIACASFHHLRRLKHQSVFFLPDETGYPVTGVRDFAIQLQSQYLLSYSRMIEIS